MPAPPTDTFQNAESAPCASKWLADFVRSLPKLRTVASAPAGTASQAASAARIAIAAPRTRRAGTAEGWDVIRMRARAGIGGPPPEPHRIADGANVSESGRDIGDKLPDDRAFHVHGLCAGAAKQFGLLRRGDYRGRRRVDPPRRVVVIINDVADLK